VMQLSQQHTNKSVWEAWIGETDRCTLKEKTGAAA
jgi:hypothetical protein